MKCKWTIDFYLGHFRIAHIFFIHFYVQIRQILQKWIWVFPNRININEKMWKYLLYYSTEFEQGTILINVQVVCSLYCGKKDEEKKCRL